MSDPWQSMRNHLQEPARLLDQISDRAASEFLAWLCGLSVINLRPCLTRSQPFHAVAGMQVLACAYSGVFRMVRAVERREAPGTGNLNRGDKAPTFAALSRITYRAHGLRA